MNYLANKSYLAIIPETVEGTALKPTNFIPLINESIKTTLNLTPDNRLKGSAWKGDDLMRGIRKHEGDLTVWGDPITLGHLFNMLYKKGTTTGSATGYTHPFTADSPKSYTFEISKGNYAQRFFGVKADQLKLNFVDGKLQAVVSIKAMGQFSVSSLKAALSGSVTSLKLSNAYDINPTTGLAIGDVISVKLDSGSWQDLTITGITDGETIAFSSTSITAAAGNAVILKPQTPSYSGLRDPLYLGNALAGIGADSATATSNAATKATSTPFYDFVLTLKNNLLDAPTFGSQDPLKLLPQSLEAELTLKQLFEDQGQRLKFLQSDKQALTLIATGQEISGGTTKESLTIKLHKIKATSNDEPLDVDQYVFDNQTFAVLYDSGDAYAIEVSIVNNAAGTVY
jgi:hypothetical protein